MGYFGYISLKAVDEISGCRRTWSTGGNREEAEKRKKSIDSSSFSNSP